MLNKLQMRIILAIGILIEKPIILSMESVANGLENATRENYSLWRKKLSNHQQQAHIILAKFCIMFIAIQTN